MTTAPPGPVLPSLDDPTVRIASGAVGGPAGRRVRPGAGWWTPVRVLLALVVLVFGLGMLTKEHCRQTSWPRTHDQYVHACYSDVPHMYRERGFALGNLPYVQEGNYERLEYPVLIGGIMAVTAAVARTADGVDAEAVLFYDLNAFLMWLCAVFTVIVLVKLVGRRPWDVAMFALAPGLLLTGTINWDLAAVLMTALALLAWARQRPALAGVLIGLGVATKLYPLLLLGPIVLLCVRAGRYRALVRTLVGAALAWLAVNVPLMLVAPEGWKAFYTFSRGRAADFGSLWYALEINDHAMPRLNTVVAVLLIGCFAAVAVLALAAPRRPRLASLTFLVVAAFALLNKVYSPQYVLWLIPLALLARPRWREFLVWQACEVLHFFAVWYHLAGAHEPDRGLPDGVYGLAIFLHVAGTLYFAAFVVRDILWPEHDPVRADGSDDPAGGVLDGAPDVVVLDPERLLGSPAAGDGPGSREQPGAWPR
jgi:uncharacterized membrane protein